MSNRRNPAPPRSRAERRRAKKGQEPDVDFEEEMAVLDASGAWPAISDKVLAEKEASHQRDSAERRGSRLGRIEVEPRRLDLHGFSLNDALDRLEQFLVEVTARGHGRVVVVTGRGKRSQGGVSVLRERVLVWLRHQAKAYVRDVEPAPPKLGGDGAWLVHLRRPRPR